MPLRLRLSQLIRMPILEPYSSTTRSRGLSRVQTLVYPPFLTPHSGSFPQKTGALIILTSPFMLRCLDRLWNFWKWHCCPMEVRTVSTICSRP